MSDYTLFELFQIISRLCFSAVACMSALFFFLGSMYGFREAPSRSGWFIRSKVFKFMNMVVYYACMSMAFTGFYYFYVYLSTVPLQAKSDYSFLSKQQIDFRWLSLNFSVDLFGCVIIMLAYFVGMFSMLSLDTRLPNALLKFYIYFNFFLLFVYIYALSRDLVVFFIAYELLLIPSFFFVYFVSYSKKAIQACLYFVIWTQAGSLLVLLCVIYIFTLTGSTLFIAIKTFPFNGQEAWFVSLMLFLGFGFKVPI